MTQTAVKKSPPTVPHRLSDRQKRSRSIIIALVFLTVITLEYSTPPPFVFGYLYTGAIVFTYRHLGRQQVILVTLAASALTLLNLVVPHVETHSLYTIANRFIAVAALLVTGYLTDRNRFYEDEITQQQAHIQSQEQLARLREDFVSTLTHDLKTPLLGTIETIHSLQEEQFGSIDSEQRKILTMMERSQQSMLKLVKTMTDVYRNDLEGLSLERSPVNLQPLLAETVSELTQLAQSRQIEVTLTSAKQEFWAWGDELQLRRVFENLLINAINHAPRKSCVETRIETVGNQPQVAVRDRGPGIDPDELSHLFERFYQSHSNRRAKGSGLGLYLSRQIVEAHNGKIWAESRDPQGAVFYCRLPVPRSHDSLYPATNSASRG